jgi:hypothetical protein
MTEKVSVRQGHVACGPASQLHRKRNLRFSPLSMLTHARQKHHVVLEKSKACCTSKPSLIPHGIIITLHNPIVAMHSAY